MRMRKHAPYTAFKLWLAGHGISYRDVAECIGCNESTVVQKIGGGSDFYMSELRQICDRFGCEISIFFIENVA